MEVIMTGLIRALCLLVLAGLLSSCMTTALQNAGTLKESNDITRKYRSLTIDPNYSYYWSGTELNPDAIMGIDKKLTVQSKFWHQVDLDKKQLEYWVIWGDRQFPEDGFSRRYMGRYMGAYILDSEGNVVGDWYSKKDWGIFEFPGNNVIIPHPPKNRAGSQRRRTF
jgi:hypothetical protein